MTMKMDSSGSAKNVVSSNILPLSTSIKHLPIPEVGVMIVSVVVVVVMVVLSVVAVVVMEVVVKVAMVTVVKVVLDVHVGVGGEDVTGGHVAVVSHLAATCTAKKKN